MKKFVEWLIRKYLPGWHLHRDPVRKPLTKAESLAQKIARKFEEVHHGNDIGSSEDKG